MSLLFLIPFIIGLIADYVSTQLPDEGAEILSITSALTLLLSVVLAPWQLKLLLLMLLLRKIH
jgi:hypothetical protein